MTEADSDDILKRMRKELEERGVLTGQPGSVETHGYTVKRSALLEYKKKYGHEYEVVGELYVIEDVPDYGKDK